MLQFICLRLFHSARIFYSAEKHGHVIGPAAINNIKLFVWFVHLYTISITYAVRTAVYNTCMIVKHLNIQIS